MEEEIIKSEQLQKALYDKISERYEKHYNDFYGQKYRLEFIYKPMFENIDLYGKKVLDAMCGGGQMTGYLLSKGARVTGLDISESAINSFRQRYPQSPNICASILNSKLEDSSFDCVAVFAGLHHLHPYVNDAIQEIHRVLKKGGYFCFGGEPHCGSLPDLIRKCWYKFDRLFAKNESSLDLDKLKRDFELCFNFIEEKYLGNIAFLFVLNSMIFRIPLKIKRLYSPLLLSLESSITKLQTRYLSCVAICQWQKK